MKVAITLLLLPLALFLVPASHAQSTFTTVTISGFVIAGPGITDTVRADASGTPSSLSGAGTDGPPFPGVTGNPLVCQFPLTGSTDGTTVTLSGSVRQSSLPALIGTHVSITAVTSSGAIKFVFGPTAAFGGVTFTFMGSGTVVISNA